MIEIVKTELTPETNYSNEELLDIIERDHGDLEMLIADALANDDSVGACASCGSISYDALSDSRTELCLTCGDFAVSSVCVLAGVL